MEGQNTADDQSHYEISLTAGQAFVAFVLLLLSLAAAFTFGLVIGKGQADGRLIVQKDTPIVSEGAPVPKKNEGEVAELTVDRDDFQESGRSTSAAEPTETAPRVIEQARGSEGAANPAATSTAPPTTPPARTETAVTASASPAVVHYAQLLSTSDQKTAEALAARLIDGGFTSAYVERTTAEKGPVYRVRVKFDSEAEARSAEPKLRAYSKDVWITSR